MNIKITTATFVIVVEEIKETIENIFDESCKSARAHFNAIKCSNMGGGGGSEAVHFYASVLE